MAEKVLEEIIDLLEDPAQPWAGKLLWHHCRNSRSCSGYSGLPDLIIVGPRAAVWVEVKPSRGARLRPEQTTWRYALSAAGHYHNVWTPDDLESGTVRSILLGLIWPQT